MEDYNKLLFIDEMLQYADMEAASKGLKVFVFYEDYLKKYFQFEYEDLALVTVAKDIDSATWNVQNFRHSYICKSNKNENKDIDV